METDIFQNVDYKEIIRHEIKAHSQKRGYHSQLARAAGCQSSFLSQVLHGHVHLTADQASGIASLWGLNEDQEEYFYLSVQFARSARPNLKSFIKRKMQDIKQRNQDIATRVKGEKMREGRDEMLYYSAWYWSAIHVAASIPLYKRPETIAQRLKLPIKLVENCLTTLHKMEFLEKRNGQWEVTKKNLHLPKESPLIGIHHVNWRQQAGINAGLGDKDALHYSVVHALSNDDYERVRTLLLEFVDKSKKIVGPSQEEEVIFLGFDCFKL